jgi:arginyl-tRNA synthetase
MKTLISNLEEIFTKSIDKSLSDDLKAIGLQSKERARISVCQNENHGHYQCNSALMLAKKTSKNPREIAQKIIDNAEKENFIFKKLEIAGPGFINITLKDKFLSDELQKMHALDHFGIDKPSKKEKVIVEFSSPNIAKELHVGHLRCTIIGDSIARLFEFLDYDVLRLNHIGDWGTQFGMLITYLKDFEKDVISGKKHSDLQELTIWYKAAKKCFDEDESFKKRAQAEVVNLQSGNVEAKKIWQIICDISREAFEEIYKVLDIRINERGESFYNSTLPVIVKDLEGKDLITISDGAKCVFLEGYKGRDDKPFPVIVQKSDGGYNYDTTDIAAFKYRIEKDEAKRIVVLTDLGQSLHFKMIYDLVVKAAYLDPEVQKFDHVTFGLVLGPDGKKFKTRSGDTEKLVDLLKKAVIKAKEKISEKSTNFSENELDDLSQIIGIDAIKYADLSCLRTKDYRFSYDKMLKFEGNTAPFLLYSYVRIMGIFRKFEGSESDLEKIMESSNIDLQHNSEILLGLHIRRFNEILDSFTKDLLPNRLCEYLYELAEKFNAFFRDCIVIGSEEQNSRLVLCDLTGKILKKGLYILGLKTVERM